MKCIERKRLDIHGLSARDINIDNIVHQAGNTAVNCFSAQCLFLLGMDETARQRVYLDLFITDHRQTPVKTTKMPADDPMSTNMGATILRNVRRKDRVYLTMTAWTIGLLAKWSTKAK